MRKTPAGRLLQGRSSDGFGPAIGGAGMVEVELTEGVGGSSRRNANLTD